MGVGPVFWAGDVNEPLASPTDDNEIRVGGLLLASDPQPQALAWPGAGNAQTASPAAVVLQHVSDIRLKLSLYGDLLAFAACSDEVAQAFILTLFIEGQGGALIANAGEGFAQSQQVGDTAVNGDQALVKGIDDAPAGQCALVARRQKFGNVGQAETQTARAGDEAQALRGGGGVLAIVIGRALRAGQEANGLVITDRFGWHAGELREFVNDHVHCS